MNESTRLTFAPAPVHLCPSTNVNEKAHKDPKKPGAGKKQPGRKAQFAAKKRKLQEMSMILDV